MMKLHQMEGRYFFMWQIYKRVSIYLIRHKGKTILMLMIFFFISCLLLICISTLNGTEAAAKDLRAKIGGAFYIRPYQQMFFEEGIVSKGGIPSISQKSIDEIIRADDGQIKNYNTVHYGYAKSEQINFLPGSGDSEISNMGKVTAVRDSNLIDVFLNKEYRLISGCHIQPEDENKILISAELAAKNNLEVGDMITLTHAGLDNQDGVYIDTIPKKTAFEKVEIIGIFQCNGVADNVDTPTAGKVANHIYSDSHLLVGLQEQQEGIYEGEIAFFVIDPLKMDVLVNRVKSINSIDWNNHILRENDFQYEQVAGRLQNLQRLSLALIVIASVLSIVILILILTLQLRGRIHEAGIYLSVGKSKAEIIGQFIFEAWLLLFVGFWLAFFLWLSCSDAVNGLLFDTLVQRAKCVEVQFDAKTLNYLQPDVVYSSILFIGGIRCSIRDGIDC